MATFVRSSKFRHVFCDPPRPDSTFQNLRLSTVTGDQNYIKANSLYFAVGIQGGGGPFAVIPLSRPGRIEPEQPHVSGHTAAVLDFDFNPFDDSIIASASEDQTVKVWSIPEGGLTANIETPVVDLHGHHKKVTFLKFHPTASNVLASTSADQSVKLWDIEQGAEINSLNDQHTDLIQDIVWDLYGSTYVTSSKDKNVRIVDARSATVASVISTAHEGSKSTKLAYLGNFDKVVTVGFNKQSQRQFKVWDPRNTSAELKKVDIDQAAGAMMPFYDPDTSILYLAGKGDGNVRYYEMSGEDPFYFPLSDYRTNVSAKGMAFVPKRGLNIMACETARLMKLTTNAVEPLSFYVPRKSEAFQEDIYPDTFAGIPSHTAAEWLSGSDLPPVLKSLNPSGASSSASQSSSSPPRAAFRSVAVVQAELDAANARIAELTARLEAAGLSTD